MASMASRSAPAPAVADLSDLPIAQDDTGARGRTPDRFAIGPPMTSRFSVFS